MRDNRSRDNESRLYLFAIATAFQEFAFIVKCCPFTSTFVARSLPSISYKQKKIAGIPNI